MSLVVLASAQKEHRAVELGLPAHLLWLCADRLRKEGYALRPDVFINLSNAAAAALAGLPRAVIVPVAKQIDEVATMVLRELSFDDLRDGIMSCAMLTLKLVDERLFLDPTNQAVLVSTALAQDAMDAGSDLPFNEAVLQHNVGRLLVRLTLLGYFQAPRIALHPAYP
jgi:hypothetical protein